MQLIDGKAVSATIKKEIAEEVNKIVHDGGKRPHLAAILVGHDGGSETYVASKVKACEECGFKSTLIRYESDVTEEELSAAYADVVGGLIEGGVDFILIETAMDAANVKIAIEECRKIDSEIPIVVSAVLSRIEGRVASGATIDKFLEDIPLEEVMAVGFNCSNGVKAAEASLKMLAAKCDKPIILYPSAGQPIVAANRFAKEMEALCRAGLLNIVGGCCGTTPAYTESMAKVAQRWRPRKTGKKN